MCLLSSDKSRNGADRSLMWSVGLQRHRCQIIRLCLQHRRHAGMNDDFLLRRPTSVTVRSAAGGWQFIHVDAVDDVPVTNIPLLLSAVIPDFRRLGTAVWHVEVQTLFDLFHRRRTVAGAVDAGRTGGKGNAADFHRQTGPSTASGHLALRKLQVSRCSWQLVQSVVAAHVAIVCS